MRQNGTNSHPSPHRALPPWCGHQAVSSHRAHRNCRSFSRRSLPLLDMMSSGTLGATRVNPGWGSWVHGGQGERRQSLGTHVVVMISSLVLRTSSTGPWNLQNRAAGRESSESQATAEAGVTGLRGHRLSPALVDRLNPSLPGHECVNLGSQRPGKGWAARVVAGSLADTSPLSTPEHPGRCGHLTCTAAPRC